MEAHLILSLLGFVLAAGALLFFAMFPAMAIFATYHAITTGDHDSIPIAIIAWMFTFGITIALLNKLSDWR